MRMIAEEASSWCAAKGAFGGEHGDGLCRGGVDGSAPTSFEALADIRLGPGRFAVPQRIINPPRWTAALMRFFAPNYKVIPIKTALDWQFGMSKRPGDPETSAPEHRQLGFKRWRCWQQYRKFDAGTMPQRDPRRTTSRAAPTPAPWRCPRPDRRLEGRTR
jgi:hypothetical protein